MTYSAVSSPKFSMLTAAELSHIIRLEDITQAPLEICIKATAMECAALAARFEVPAVKSLSVEVTCRRTKSGNGIRIDGIINARFTQICGATLERMPRALSEEAFSTEYTLSAWEKYSEFDIDQAEVLTDDFIDIGEIIAQYFYLALDPYPVRTAEEQLARLAAETAQAARDIANAVPANPSAPKTELLTQEVIEKTLNLSVVASESATDSAFFRYLKQMQAR